MTMKVLRRETRMLAIQLDADQVRERGNELAHTIQEIEMEDTRQTALKSQMKATMTGLEARQTKLASVVVNRVEYQDVEVEVQFSESGGVVQEVRTDTGEIIRTRPCGTMNASWRWIRNRPPSGTMTTGIR